MPNPFLQFAEYLLLGTLLVCALLVVCAPLLLFSQIDWAALFQFMKDNLPIMSSVTTMISLLFFSVLILIGYSVTLLRIWMYDYRNARTLHEEIANHRGWFEIFLHQQAPEYEKAFKSMNDISILWEPRFADLKQIFSRSLRAQNTSLRRKVLSAYRLVFNFLMSYVYCYKDTDKSYLSNQLFFAETAQSISAILYMCVSFFLSSLLWLILWQLTDASVNFLGFSVSRIILVIALYVALCILTILVAKMALAYQRPAYRRACCTLLSLVYTIARKDGSLTAPRRVLIAGDPSAPES